MYNSGKEAQGTTLLHMLECCDYCSALAKEREWRELVEVIEMISKQLSCAAVI